MATHENAPVVAGRRQLGATLARLRRQASRTVGETAEHLDWPADMVGRVESGQAALRLAEARALLDLYEVRNGRREKVVDLARQVGAGTWWLPYGDLVDAAFERQLILEDEARLIRVHQPNLIPGLLQTERYAWELMTTVVDQQPAAVRRRVDLRILRQQILSRSPAPAVDVVLDEAALRRPVGDADVMREQYERLVELSAAPNVEIRVLSFPSGPSRASGHGFHIFTPRGGEPAVVQLELLDREYFADAAEEVGHYLAAFEHARSRALDAERSRAFLAALAAPVAPAAPAAPASEPTASDQASGGGPLPRSHLA